MKCDKHNFIYYKTEKFKEFTPEHAIRFFVSDKFICSYCGKVIEKLVNDRIFNLSEMEHLPIWVKVNFYPGG